MELENSSLRGLVNERLADTVSVDGYDTDESFGSNRENVDEYNPHAELDDKLSAMRGARNQYSQVSSTPAAKLLIRTTVNAARDVDTRGGTRVPSQEVDTVDVKVKKQKNVAGSSEAMDLVLNRIEHECRMRELHTEDLTLMCKDLLQRVSGDVSKRADAARDWAAVC